MDGSRLAHCAGTERRAIALSNVARPTYFTGRISDHRNQSPVQGPEYCPFRPFLVQEADAHYVGVIYHHWPADSGSIKTLLREWFRSMYDPSRMRTTPLTIAEKGFWHYFGPSTAKWDLFDGTLALLRHRTRFSRVRQSKITEEDDFTVKVTIHPQPDGLADKLLAAARSLGFTVNDIFLAAMAECCHTHGTCPQTRDRDELALGTIVDLRMLAPQSMDDLFGMFLGFTNTIVRRQDLTDWDRLLSHIANQTAFQKRSRSSQASVLRMIGGLCKAHFLPARKWINLYRRKMPMAAGISNINMNRHWTAEYCPSPIVEYLRVAPTSAILPVTFGTTTTGRKMNIVLTRQTAFFDDAASKRLLDAFLLRLRKIVSTAETPPLRLI